jgi:hypothetical protein
MDWSKDGKAGGGGAPTMTIAAKGSAAPVVGPVRVLTSAAEKGRLA